MRALKASMLISFFSLLFSGCASFHETHYFQTTDSTGATVNFFRVRVDGNGGFTKLRYLSGYYDERAVDLYFNEVKTVPTGTANVDIQPLFAANQTIPGTTDTLKPLDPTSRGALLMIFSSNPNAIADTIGQFAENQQIADALTNLVSRRDVKEQRTLTRTLTARGQRFTASGEELQALIGSVPSAATTGQKQQVAAKYLDVLRSIAITLGGDGKLKGFDDASAFIAAKRSEGQ